jgi:lipoyl-dependent peroxiredoxin
VATAKGARNGHTETNDGIVKADLSVPKEMGGPGKPGTVFAVSIGPRDGAGSGLAVKMHVEDKSIPQAELAELAKEALEKICPYSHATRGNVDVELAVAGG